MHITTNVGKRSDADMNIMRSAIAPNSHMLTTIQANKKRRFISPNRRKMVPLPESIGGTKNGNRRRCRRETIGPPPQEGTDSQIDCRRTEMVDDKTTEGLRILAAGRPIRPKAKGGTAMVSTARADQLDARSIQRTDVWRIIRDIARIRFVRGKSIHCLSA